MSTISVTKLYDLLSAKVGKETAENLTNFIENKIDYELESKTQILATKEDLARSTLATKEDIAKLALATKEDIAKLALATKEDIAKLALATKEEIAKLAFATKEEIARLDTKISETKSELMRWMFIFWASQLVATFSFILLYFKK
jgi:hypothetical protein